MKRLNTFVVLLVLFISGYIGFSTNTVTKANASNDLVIPKIVEVPKPTSGYCFDINLNSNTVKVASCPTERDINVNIQKKDSIITRYVPQIVTETKYVRVRELPALKQKKAFVSPTLKQEMPPMCIK